jgi:hypothetical protein
MHGFLTGIVATELILAAILLLMFVFDRTVGRGNFSSYFVRHLAVEAFSILSVFITIALFMIFMIKSGVNCEARQARHAIVLEQSLHHLRFKRVKVAAIAPGTEQEVEQVSKWVAHYSPRHVDFSSNRHVDSDLHTLLGSTNDSANGQESMPVDDEQDYSECNEQVVSAADSDVVSDHHQAHHISDVESKVAEEDDFSADANEEEIPTVSETPSAAARFLMGPLFGDGDGTPVNAARSSTAHTGVKLKTRADALSTLDAAIVEVFEAIRLIQSPADLRPTLVGIALRQGVWLGYTATVLTSILYSIVQLVLAIHG